MRRALRGSGVIAILALFQIALAAGARCAELSDALDHHDRALPGRRTDRHAGSHHGRPVESRARAVGHHRERHRRRRLIATGRVAHAAPDGYTIEIGHNQTHVINGATQNLNYDVVKDFEPVTLIAETPIWLIARPAVPAATLNEFVAWLKKQDGKATMGSVGVGGPGDIAAESFKRQTGTKFAFVPYRGGAPLLQDMLGGQIDFTFGQAPTYLPYVRNGQLKAFAVLMPKRWYAAPDVPTLDELGIKGIYASFWHGIWAPKGTPKPIVDKLNAAFVQTLADEGVQQRFKDIGQEIFPRDKQNPAALAEQQKSRDRTLVAGHQGRRHQIGMNGRMTMRTLALVAAATLALSASAQAQSDYPNRPVKIINDSAPGSATDTAARLMAERLGGYGASSRWWRTAPAPAARLRCAPRSRRHPTATRSMSERPPPSPR